MPITEKQPHVYELTSKDMREKLGIKGVVTDIEVDPYTYKDKESGENKHAFKVLITTMDRVEN